MVGIALTRIERRGMQDCFRQHPDVYGAELEDDEAQQPSHISENTTAPTSPEIATASQLDAVSHPDDKHARAKEVRTQIADAAVRDGEQAESDQLIPKAWHDTDKKNEETKAQKTEK